MTTLNPVPYADELERLCLDHEEEHSTATFHNFSKLSDEIRVMIWKLAISRRQIASLTQGKSSGLNEDIKYGRLPAFLFVNKEARWVVPIHFTYGYRKWEDPLRRPRKGLQHCMLGPDDIVALRIDNERYRMWEYLWNSGKCETKRDYIRFPGRWEGDYRAIHNWMTSAPLNAFHNDPYRDCLSTRRCELNELDSSKCNEIVNQLRIHFARLLSNDPYCRTYQLLHILAYGWDQPNMENLTAYDFETIQNCLTGIHQSEGIATIFQALNFQGRFD
ncbi:hypothetical protein F5B21DRAFT_509189 [Xylaria acuta]|nr:hypothetical protein F5B21DRAFT_509189 [Xylaria acuta]